MLHSWPWEVGDSHPQIEIFKMGFCLFHVSAKIMYLQKKLYIQVAIILSKVSLT